MDDEGPAILVIRPHELITHPQPLGQRDRPRLLREKRVWPGLDEKPVNALGGDGSAETILGFKQRDLYRQSVCTTLLDESMSRCKPSDPATDNNYPWCVHMVLKLA